MITGSLGIKGWSSDLDKMLLTGIITGDPLLMLSDYGQAKTSFVDRFGQILLSKLRDIYPERYDELNVSVINAATSNHQDWAGYFIPDSSGGKMKLLESPGSLLHSVMIAVDEISRTAPRNQNNVLTLIQERRVDGLQTACEILFAMMNPVMGDNADEGSEPLIGALADRFALTIEPPSFHLMNDVPKREVIRVASPPSAKVSMFTDRKDLGKDKYLVSQSVIDDVWTFLTEAKALYLRYFFDQKYVGVYDSVIEYTSQIVSTLVNDKVTDLYVSGRRAGMIPRSIIAAYAVNSVLGQSDLPAAAGLSLVHSFPNKAMAKTFDPMRLKRVHDIAAKILKSGANIMTAIMAEPNKWRRLKMGFDGAVKPDDFARLYTDVVRDYPPERYAELVIGLAIGDRLTRKLSKHELSKIGDVIVKAAGVPVQDFSMAVKTSEDVETAMTLLGGGGVDSDKKLVACMYIAQQNGGSPLDYMNGVTEIYDLAKKVVEGKK